MSTSKLFNLARMTTATTGTGPITLGSAVSGFLTFGNAGAADGDVVSYAIRDGANSEIGTGTYNTAGTTLTRTTILRSTNSNTAITLSGNAQVFITPNATDLTPAGLGAAASGANTDITSMSGLTGNAVFTSAGKIGLGITPIYQLDIRNATNGPQLHLSGTTSDEGAYIMAQTLSGFNFLLLGAGASNDGTNWIAKNASATILVLGAGSYDVYNNTGLTPGSTFSPTALFHLNTAGVYPEANNSVPTGRSANRWSEVWSVDGNFSGAITIGGGATINGGVLNVTDATDSTSTASGAIQTLGGIGVAKNITCGAYVLHSVTDSITAAGTTQAGATALTTDRNIITAGTGGVRLPTAVVGMDITVRNNLGVSVNVYPATGASINALAANSSVAIGAVNTSRFIATSSTQWRTA